MKEVSNLIKTFPSWLLQQSLELLRFKKKGGKRKGFSYGGRYCTIGRTFELVFALST